MACTIMAALEYHEFHYKAASFSFRLLFRFGRCISSFKIESRTTICSSQALILRSYEYPNLGFSSAKQKMSESQISAQLPVLDLSEDINQDVLSSLAEACEEWGFFYVANHGVSENLFAKLFSLSRKIFSLSIDSKLKLGPCKTYTPPFIASPYFESLVVAGPDFFASAESSIAELFGHHSSEISELLEEYGRKMVELSKRIVSAVLMSLGECYESKFYESEFSKCHGYLRMVNYSEPEKDKGDEKEKEDEEEVEGLGMHTDMSCLTIVYQDEVGGLQMRSNGGKWMDIKPCDKCLVVNVGDLMQAWTNGRFRSSEHRVVLKHRSVNRRSLAFFWCFEDEKVISAPDEVVGEDKSRIYTPFVCSDYLKFRESNEVGKFDRIGYTINDFALILNDDQQKH